MIERFGLYVILTNPVIGYEAAAEAAVSEKVRYLQLRIKNEPEERIFKIAEKISAITKGSGTSFIINDSVEIAKAVNADGVHLGQDDMSLDEARRMWSAPGKLFGLSTHNIEQSSAAAAYNPDYIGVGPVFATPTKAIPDPVLGLKTMGEMIRQATLTTVAIGGIDEENLPSVLNSGAINFCAVRAIMESTAPEIVIRRMMSLWEKVESQRC